MYSPKGFFKKKRNMKKMSAAVHMIWGKKAPGAHRKDCGAQGEEETATKHPQEAAEALQNTHKTQKYTQSTHRSENSDDIPTKSKHCLEDAGQLVRGQSLE